VKTYLPFIVGLFLAACQPQDGDRKENQSHYFYVGTYTEGQSEGIYRYQLKPDGSMHRMGLAAPSRNPSFLALTPDGNFLLAVNETNQEGTGTIESYKTRGDTLIRISTRNSGGAHPCHLAVDPQGWVVTANYTSGNVGLLRLNSQGKLSNLQDLHQHEGSGSTPRQEGPHAHMARFVPDNQVIATDLGTNELWFYRLDTTRGNLIPEEPRTLSMAKGAGPRHMTFHPNGQWIYVINELNSTITPVHKKANGNYQKEPSVSTLPKDFQGTNFCADIHISSDGNYLYASNRGHNSIAVFHVNPDDGSLHMIGHHKTRGDWPRNFSLSPDEKYLLVANQRSNNIVAFQRNSASGVLKYLGQIEAPIPVCILFE
jgi:6-phosphogluconolactonase